jgi:anti-anti-sigma regulatory factor
VPLPINLAAVDAAHLGRILPQAPAALLVDCGALPCQRTHGICFLVSQLLVLRQTGARVWLHNTSPVLRHCLHKLQISSLFTLTD